MQITVVGTGYVGLVVGACLAETGNDVVCADIDAGKIARLNGGEIPIYEPGLEPLVERNLSEGRIRFTTDVADAVRGAEVIFIAVGTPPGWWTRWCCTTPTWARAPRSAPRSRTSPASWW